MDDLRRIDLNLLLTLHALLVDSTSLGLLCVYTAANRRSAMALAQLRELFADPLLVRQGGRLQLTARARELMPPLQDALQQLDALLVSPGFDPARARRSFRLAMSDYGARVLLPPLLARLREEGPVVDLVVTQGSREAMLGQLIRW